MKATVIRTGQHSGGDLFAEVQETPSSPPYAVPINAPVEVGTVLEVITKVVELVPVVVPAPVGTDVSTRTKEPLVVPESPLAVPSEPRKDTAPSGQVEVFDPALRDHKEPLAKPERTKGADDTLKKGGK